MKKILILNGSFCEKPIISKAKEMGFYVVTTGNVPQLMGHKLADAYIPCDYSDKEAVLQLVKDHGIEGIISCANDFGVLTAAFVAEQMGWSGHDSYQNALLMHHKDQFKKYCIEHGIPSPHSVVFTSKEDAQDYCRTVEYPVIVKANDLTGGKGIRRAGSYEEAKEAIANAFAWSRDKHVLVEPYLTGTQHSFCAFLVRKKIAAVSSCKCYSFVNPYLIQAETFPSCELDDSIKRELEGIILDMAQDLDLADGILNLQFIIQDHKPYIIEMMRRCFGNEALTTFGMVSDYDWEEAYIRAALGMDCAQVKRKQVQKKYCGHYGIMAEKNGVLKRCEIPAEIEKHVFKKIDMILPGGRVLNYLNERVAYLYYEYDSLEQMNEEVLSFRERIVVEVE